MLHARATPPGPALREARRPRTFATSRLTKWLLLCDRGPARALGLAHCGNVVLPKLRTPVLARARGLLLRDGIGQSSRGDSKGLTSIVEGPLETPIPPAL